MLVEFKSNMEILDRFTGLTKALEQSFFLNWSEARRIGRGSKPIAADE
jgi:hypothetical protein